MEPLFDLPDLEPSGETHDCDRCCAEVNASLDGLRVRGWLAFDGMSETGQPLRVRVCPACQEKGAREMQRSGKAPRSRSPRTVPLLPRTPPA